MLNFDEGNDTADEDAAEQVVVTADVHMPVLQQPESPAYVVHMPELQQPESPAQGFWLHWVRPDNVQGETEKERAARIAENSLEELMWQKVVIGDTLVPYERPLVTDGVRWLLASQPINVLPEDSSRAANAVRGNRQNQLSNLMEIANRTNTQYNHTFPSHRHINKCK